ncbi:tRNA pseudouridine55 synthase [Caloramator fervidus]|uniref:tRNA pseudouridine synthase B n=1 Tax=Caloramator fervidus TaxID=29344 RepID=A0A1H5S5Z7_9CLOT|nr:tRNA pseudouridine(55) synthase TruB [Caloramator fervidus]SEF45870.1 tRNA pseudouridine55 synthase [Caloramator fervidus]
MDGVLNILKPPGMTSHDVVDYIRKIFKVKKVGHTGTLDPGAAGVLPICIGKATKIVEYLTNDIKEYICELTLGNATDTFDKYGNFLHEEKDCSYITENDIKKIIGCFLGEIEQIPPKYSAIKINGKRAYELARHGVDIEIPSRKVFIYEIELMHFSLPKVLLRVVCSKGTYIRTLCNDIGNALGCSGYMSFLLRTRAGNFKIQDSIPLDMLSKDNIDEILVKIEDALDFPNFYVENKYKKLLINGNSIKVNRFHDKSKRVKIYCDKIFVGIGRLEKTFLYVEKLLI